MNKYLKSPKCHFLLMFCLTVVMLSSSSCSINHKVSSEILSSYAKAKSLYVKGDLDQALVIFLTIEKSNADFLNNLFMIGKVYYFKNDFKSAEEAWLSLLKKNQYHVDALKWLGQLNILKADYAISERYITRALEIDSDNPELLLIMGKINFFQKDYKTAIEFYKKAQLFNDRLLDSHVDLAQIYAQFGFPDIALKEIDTALTMSNPESPYNTQLLQIRKNIEKGSQHE